MRGVSASDAHTSVMEHFFTTYVRTKLVFQTRLKDLNDYDTVKIYMYEMNKLRVSGETIFRLREEGEIFYDDIGRFKPLKAGSVDPLLLEQTRKWKKTKRELTPLYIYMRDVLKLVSIDGDLGDLPIYFKTFLLHRHRSLDMFFTVDGFSGRVHTPIVNLKGIFRSRLRLNGSLLCSLDVKQIQPTILAKILEDNVGHNPFSLSVERGNDIYMLLLQQNDKLTTRDDAKKFLYRLIFGFPMDDIGSMFKGDTSWVQWINNFKSVHQPGNPHGRDMHTNLAWLLQTKEVAIMSSAWEKLKEKNIPFLTIHDDILVMQRDKTDAYDILHRELKSHFKRFEIIVR